jgi:hypothetical protein
MKEQLPNLYLKGQRQFKDIITQFPDDDLAGPFLMSPNSLYAFQENPLLIVGQETCAWENSIDDLNKQMKFYEVFNVGLTISQHLSGILHEKLRQFLEIYLTHAHGQT